MTNVIFEEPNFEELGKKGFVCADLHLHSTYSDGIGAPGEILKKARRLGITVSITDHNKVEGSVKAYNSDKKRIIPGIELTTQDAHDLLVYFYNIGEIEEFYNKYIKGNKIINSGFNLNRLTYSNKEMFDILKKYNCLTALAHPCAPYPKKSFNYFKKQDLKYLDAIEVINATAVSHKKNLKSLAWASYLEKPLVGTSDAHDYENIGKAVVAIKDSANNFLDQIKKKKNFVIGYEIGFKDFISSSWRLIKHNFVLRKWKHV